MGFRVIDSCLKSDSASRSLISILQKKKRNGLSKPPDRVFQWRLPILDTIDIKMVYRGRIRQ
jgi:hypothetical protein